MWLIFSGFIICFWLYSCHKTVESIKAFVIYLQRDGCPKIVNLGSAKTDLFYERKKYGFKKRWRYFLSASASFCKYFVKHMDHVISRLLYILECENVQSYIGTSDVNMLPYNVQCCESAECGQLSWRPTIPKWYRSTCNMLPMYRRCQKLSIIDSTLLTLLGPWDNNYL